MGDGMHLAVMTYGHKPVVDKWLVNMMANHYKFKMPDNKPWRIELGVREWKMIDFVFPKNAYHAVADTIGRFNNPGRFQYALKGMQKMLGYKDMDYEPKWNGRVWNRSVTVHPIGIKEDVFNPEGLEMI